MVTSSLQLSRKDARKIILAAQGLNRSHPFGTGSSSVIKAIEHLGYVQLDTISVVERAHHHVLWSRIPSYQSDWLHAAQLKQRRVFEYWSHAAAYLPMKDFRYSLLVMKVFQDQKDRWPKSGKADMKKVLKRIREEGPLMSRSFDSDHKGGAWWDWKPDKWALQRLFLEGQLMVSHRENFQRVYDLPERIIPYGIDTSMPSTKDYYSFLITQTLQAQGIAARGELIHLRHISHRVFDEVLHELLEQGVVLSIDVEGNKKYFTLPSCLEKKTKVQDKISILSPFDNGIIWRKRLKDIFEFDYTLECYLPSRKRQYGYFCLPILYKDQFAGRIDMKAERKNGLLQIQNLSWNEGSEELRFLPQFEQALQAFAAFNQCDDIAFPK